MRTTDKHQRDSQRQAAITHCSLCGGELYPGDICWHVNGSIICENCLGAFAEGEFAAHRVVCGREVGR